MHGLKSNYAAQRGVCNSAASKNYSAVGRTTLTTVRVVPSLRKYTAHGRSVGHASTTDGSTTDAGNTNSTFFGCVTTRVSPDEYCFDTSCPVNVWVAWFQDLLQRSNRST